MARSTGDDKKTEVVQTRVSADIKEQLEEQLDENGQTLADYVRDILTSVTSDDADAGRSVKTALLCDLYTLGTAVGDQDTLHTLLIDNWDQLLADRDAVRDTVFNTEGTVYLTGQNACYAVSAWLSNRLNDRGLDACVHAGEDVPIAALDEDDTLIAVSRTGTTGTVCHAASRALSETDATVIGFAHEPLEIDYTPGDTDRYHYITLPPVTEQTDHYATRSAIVQMAVLHLAILADSPDQDAAQQVCQHVEQFIQDQMAAAPTDPGENDPEPPTLQATIRPGDGQQYFLDGDSPFMQAAAALSQEGDLGDDPVFASLEPWHQLSWLGVQAHIEFLHTNATHVSLGSVRDAVLNVLYRGNAVLLTTVPFVEDVEDDRDRNGPYSRTLNYLFGGGDSIDDLLRINLSKPGKLRLLAFTFNDLEHQVENEIQVRSLYRDDAVIQLPDPADSLDDAVSADMVELARDLTVATAHFVLVYAILEKRWTQDRKLREEVMRGPDL